MKLPLLTGRGLFQWSLIVFLFCVEPSFKLSNTRHYYNCSQEETAKKVLMGCNSWDRWWDLLRYKWPRPWQDVCPEPSGHFSVKYFQKYQHLATHMQAACLAHHYESIKVMLCLLSRVFECVIKIEATRCCPSCRIFGEVRLVFPFRVWDAESLRRDSRAEPTTILLLEDLFLTKKRHLFSLA